MLTRLLSNPRATPRDQQAAPAFPGERIYKAPPAEAETGPRGSGPRVGLHLDGHARPERRGVDAEALRRQPEPDGALAHLDDFCRRPGGSRCGRWSPAGDADALAAAPEAHEALSDPSASRTSRGVLGTQCCLHDTHDCAVRSILSRTADRERPASRSGSPGVVERSAPKRDGVAPARGRGSPGSLEVLADGVREPRRVQPKRTVASPSVSWTSTGSSTSTRSGPRRETRGEPARRWPPGFPARRPRSNRQP